MRRGLDHRAKRGIIDTGGGWPGTFARRIILLCRVDLHPTLLHRGVVV